MCVGVNECYCARKYVYICVCKFVYIYMTERVDGIFVIVRSYTNECTYTLYNIQIL